MAGGRVVVVEDLVILRARPAEKATLLPSGDQAGSLSLSTLGASQ